MWCALRTRIFATRYYSSITRSAPHDSNALVPSDAQRNTIFALSTPPGKAGIAVVRVSGPNTLKVFKQMVKPPNEYTFRMRPIPWRVQRCRVVDPESGVTLDSALSVFFAGKSKGAS
jgi:tRNA modification GTPase